MRVLLAMSLAALLQPAAWAADDLSFGYVTNPGPGEQPALIISTTKPIETLVVEITAGGQTFSFEKHAVAPGKDLRLPWKRDESVTEAVALVRADFVDGHVEQFEVPVQYEYAVKLEVDLSKAKADVAARTLTVRTTAAVDSADITAYGAGKAVLDQSTVPLSGGPGEVVVPWVGDPSDVVLLDITLRRGNSWTGFTYSPWFLDIPHDDVLFESDKADILAPEIPKLEATLAQLNDVIDKYGSVVPVKLYVAGCTDTVGNTAHNQDLSKRRAKAIASWLRAHGFDKPIYYYGMGESFLAVPTGDEVDEGRNRRAVYLVGANPPPAGSGVPQVSWIPL